MIQNFLKTFIEKDFSRYEIDFILENYHNAHSQ